MCCGDALHSTIADLVPTTTYLQEAPSEIELEYTAEAAARKREIEFMMKKSHHDSQGNLDAQGLRDILINYSRHYQLSLTPADPKPDDRLDIEFCRIASIDETEIDFAITLWRVYLLHKDRIESLIDQQFKDMKQSRTIKKLSASPQPSEKGGVRRWLSNTKKPLNQFVYPDSIPSNRCCYLPIAWFWYRATTPIAIFPAGGLMKFYWSGTD